MKTYRIKEFAGNLGVTEKTLRHYEKYKIVEPSVDESNGYRSYNFRDAERILVSRRFSSMEFSVKETSRLLSESSIDEVMEAFRIQSEKLEQKAEHLRLVAQRMRELEDELGWFKGSANRGFIREGNEWWFIRHVKNTEFVRDRESLGIIRKMMDALPCSVKMMPIPEKMTKDRDVIWGMAIDPRYAAALGIDFQPPMVKIPAETCYVYPAVISAKKERILEGGQDVPEIWGKIQRELEEMHVSVTGVPYVIGSIDSFSGELREKHFLFWAPVKG